MKHEISTPMAAGMIAVIVVIVLLIGFKVMKSDRGGQGNDIPAKAKAEMEKNQGAMRHFESLGHGPQGNNGAGSPGMGSPGMR